MITQDNFKSLLLSLGFEENGDVLSKHFSHTEGMLKVDFNKKELIYPEDKVRRNQEQLKKVTLFCLIL